MYIVFMYDFTVGLKVINKQNNYKRLLRKSRFD